MPEPERETRELSCALTPDDLVKRGEQMAACELAIEALKAERKSVNDRIAAEVDRRNELAHVIDAGVEDRQVLCTWHEDFAHNVYRLVRQDTGDEVDTRVMTADDRQVPLFDPPARRHIDKEPEHLDA